MFAGVRSAARGVLVFAVRRRSLLGLLGHGVVGYTAGLGPVAHHGGGAGGGGGVLGDGHGTGPAPRVGRAPHLVLQEGVVGEHAQRREAEKLERKQI